MPYAKRARTSSRSRAPVRRTAKHYSKRKRIGGTTKRSYAPVSIGTSNRGGPMANHKMVQVSDTCTRVYGRSYLGNVTNNKVAGDVVTAGSVGPPVVPAGPIGGNPNEFGLVFDINPTLLGDRVAVMAGTYDKYCYQSMKFTYTPQCSTTQHGSIVLAFERDPQGILANAASNTYMQEIMSYEHAVLTPAWQSTSVTYKRDPHEVKTWFMSGDQAVVTTRETSQGVLLAYCSNVETDAVNLGFITMDYVLDFIAPNIMPSKANPVQPEQFRKSDYNCFSMQVQQSGGDNWFVFGSADTEASRFNAGDIIECIYSGGGPCGGFSSIIDGAPKITNINPGDKLYIAVGSYTPSGASLVSKTGLVFTNLAHALGSPGRYTGAAVPVPTQVQPAGSLYPTVNTINQNPFLEVDRSTIATNEVGLRKKRYLYFRKIVEGGQQDTTS